MCTLRRAIAVRTFCWLFACAAAGCSADDDAPPSQVQAGASALPDASRPEPPRDAGPAQGAGSGGMSGRGSAGGGGGSGDSGDGANAGLCSSDGNCEQQLELAPAVHLADPIDYADKPPAGGPHNNCWARWVEHTQPVADEIWVHNLEHGGIVLLYNCTEACSSELDQLRSFASSHARTLLTPYAEMTHRFAAVAWGYRLQMDALDTAALERFYTAHLDHGPESLPNPPPTGCP